MNEIIIIINVDVGWCVLREEKMLISVIERQTGTTCSESAWCSDVLEIEGVDFLDENQLVCR